jgi:hypothetical protein
MESYLRRWSGNHAQRARTSSPARNTITTPLLPAAVLAVCLLGILILGACQAFAADPDKQPVPPTPVPVQRILVARPFTLQVPFTYDWSKERPSISSGTLVVLAVDGAYVVPRNATVGPTLYAGDTPVMRLNHGFLSGRVIGIVPDTVNLATAPLWFATPGKDENLKAERAFMSPLPAAQLRAARRPPASAKDLAALLRTAGADLVLEFSPQEKALAEIWRLPVAKPPPASKVN